MQRRTFLHLCLGTAATTAAAGSALLRPGRPLVIEGRALFPGVPLQVRVAGDVPPGARLRVRVERDGVSHPCPELAAPSGGRLELETPYPFDDLVAGTYHVYLDLVTAGGALLEHRCAGGYCIEPFRFSA